MKIKVLSQEEINKLRIKSYPYAIGENAEIMKKENPKEEMISLTKELIADCIVGICANDPDRIKVIDKHIKLPSTVVDMSGVKEKLLNASEAELEGVLLEFV